MSCRELSTPEIGKGAGRECTSKRSEILGVAETLAPISHWAYKTWGQLSPYDRRCITLESAAVG